MLQFHQFVADQIARRPEELSPEDCLDAWRAAHPLPAQLAESVAAVQQALDEARRGEGVSLDEFDRQFRQEHHLPASDE
ncbi:MAG: hypothetical protein AB7U73_12800 [Pirellulales bacterium]